MIAGIGLPYAYDHFEKEESPGNPPFICFLYPESENVFADSRVYQKVKTLRIELYTDNKEPDMETAVEDALDEAGLCYDSSEEYIESEKMYMVTWETTVIITKNEEVPEDEHFGKE